MTMSSFDISVAELRAALKFVSRAIDKRPARSIPAFDCVMIAGGVLSVVDLDVQATARLVIPDGHLPVVLNAAKLASAIATAGGSTVSILPQPDGAGAVVSTGSGSVVVPGVPVADIPQMAPTNDDTPIEYGVSAADMRRYLRAALPSVCNDAVRYYLGGVLMTFEEACVVMVSTDGYRVARIRTSITAHAEQPSVIVPHKAMKILSTSLPASGKCEARLAIQQSRVSLSWGAYSLETRVIDGEFPNYARIMPVPAGSPALLGTKSVICAAKAAIGAGALGVRIDTTAAMLTFGGDVEGHAAINVVAPAGTPDTTHADLGYNPRYLADAFVSIDILGCNLAEYHPSIDYGPAAFRAEGIDVIIMPRRY